MGQNLQRRHVRHGLEHQRKYAPNAGRRNTERHALQRALDAMTPTTLTQPSPQAIRASLPEVGRRLTFTRSLQVDARDDMRIRLETEREQDGDRGHPLAALVLIFAAVAGLGRLGRPPQPNGAAAGQ